MLTNTTFTFRVRNNGGQDHVVRAGRAGGGGVWMSCSCARGGGAAVCRHRVAVLGGEIAGLTSGNVDDVAALSALIKGSEAERCLGRLLELRDAMEAARVELRKCRRMLAQAMSDPP